MIKKNAKIFYQLNTRELQIKSAPKAAFCGKILSENSKKYC